MNATIQNRSEETFLYRAICNMSHWLLDTFYRTEYVGMLNNPNSGGYLLASNHASYMDPPLVGNFLTRSIFYFARKTLMSNPVAAYVYSKLAVIPVDRDGPSDVAAIRRVIGLVRGGNGLLVFPEGTRSKDGKLGEAKAGVGMLACMTGVPVVPCRLFNTYDALPKGRGFFDFSKPITAVYLPPLASDQYDPPGVPKKERYDRVANVIMDQIRGIEEPIDRII